MIAMHCDTDHLLTVSVEVHEHRVVEFVCMALCCSVTGLHCDSNFLPSDRVCGSSWARSGQVCLYHGCLLLCSLIGMHCGNNILLTDRVCGSSWAGSGQVSSCDSLLFSCTVTVSDWLTEFAEAFGEVHEQGMVKLVYVILYYSNCCALWQG